MRPFGALENSMKSGFSPSSAGNVTSMPVSVRILWLFATRLATARSTTTRSGTALSASASSKRFCKGSSANTSPPRSHGASSSDSSALAAMYAFAFDTATAALAPYSSATSSTMRHAVSNISLLDASVEHCRRPSGMSRRFSPAMARSLSQNSTSSDLDSTTANDDTFCEGFGRMA